MYSKIAQLKDVSALRADPLFDPVRKDPRFTALMAKLDFP